VVNADHQGEKAAFNEILKKLPETLSNAYTVSSAGLPCNPDHLHFTAEGQREFGRRYAEKLLSLPGHTTRSPAEQPGQ
jgi:lysophospholipase L1-like esterase